MKLRESSAGKKASGSVEKQLVENLIELQKVQTALAEKFDKLSAQISSLLSLFETTAKSFAKSPGNQVTEKDRDFLDKIDKLLEQNKTIARGLTLMEERNREKIYGSKPQIDSPSAGYSPSQMGKPLPKF